MKSLTACLAAVFTLAGCVAVPYAPYDAGPGYGYSYGPVAPAFSFNYSYRDGGYYHHRHRRW